ncbi:hypothetical protein [Alkalispirochaeta sphaeroplastigenens]|uniref:hypothetical protein n=1 Tax=Alkalispirochaeta sphaeroplastigenens TaxID=1187066 RepID=UPI001FE2C5B3|nr:hypothetical protein [Alkalispirochaeta sphaeroplastigenens]
MILPPARLTLGESSRGQGAVRGGDQAAVATKPELGYAGPVKLVVFILNNEDLLERVLEAYVEAGIQGATILDSEGMGRFLSYEVPLFAEFRRFMKGNKPYNKTIISVVPDAEVIPRLESLLDQVVGGLSSGGTGIFFTVPVDYAAGLIDHSREGAEP